MLLCTNRFALFLMCSIHRLKRNPPFDFSRSLVIQDCSDYTLSREYKLSSYSLDFVYVITVLSILFDIKLCVKWFRNGRTNCHFSLTTCCCARRVLLCNLPTLISSRSLVCNTCPQKFVRRGNRMNWKPLKPCCWHSWYMSLVMCQA